MVLIPIIQAGMAIKIAKDILDTPPTSMDLESKIISRVLLNPAIDKVGEFLGVNTDPYTVKDIYILAVKKDSNQICNISFDSTKKGIIAKSEEYKGSDYSWVIYSFYRIPEYVKDYAESQTSWKKLKGQMQKNYALEWEKKAQDFLTNLEQDTEVIVEIESKNGCVELVNVHSLEDKKNISDKITKIAQTAKDVAIIALSDHLEKVKKLHEENEFLQNQNKKLQEEFENRFGDNDQYRLDLEEEQLELMIKNEELSEENKAILDEFLLMQQQHKALQLQLLQSQKKKYDYLKDRITIYKNIVFEKDSFDEFVLLTEDDSRSVEEQIQLLNHKPDDVNFRCKIAGTNFLEIGFGSQGRLYVKRMGGKYHIYKIGNKATQPNDIKYLKTL